MPIAVCKTKEQVLNWCEKVLKKEGSYYIYYTTEDQEVILEPAKSTRPLRYCYIKLTPTEQDQNPAKTLAMEIGNEYEQPVIEISRMAWDVEKGPAIKIPVVE
jgi:bifunctional DNA-binding transcriptional regulator/antitoxin component of YhaV-PrlF toxin-antitoxin module